MHQRNLESALGGKALGRMAFRGFRIGFFVLVCAVLVALVPAARVGAEADEKHEAHAAGKDDDHGAPTHPASAGQPHHEPSALEHVMDEKKSWPLFHSFGPHGIPLPEILGQPITKFMLLELIAAGLVLAIYLPLARRLQSGIPARGGWDNAFEVLLTYVRDQIAKPNIGEHDADRFTPFLWTLFLFILFNNLLGMFPFFGSATASIFVTLGLAIVVFFAIHGSAIAKMGFRHYAESMWPHIELTPAMGIPIKILVCVIEVFGVLVRNMVLAVRLFANMFAGHMVLATILVFIYAAARSGPALWATVTVSSVLGMVLLSLLELFVAFLHAYIFTFLTSLFMGMAMHPQH